MESTVKKEPKLHSGLMEVAVAKLLNYRVHHIVPNVSWGLYLNHECDLLVIDNKNRFTEVEIKVTKADLKNDFKKPHQHSSKLISRLIYAVPESMSEFASEIIPKDCGIITVSFNTYTGRHTAKWLRQAKHKKLYREIKESEVRKFMELGLMRIWTLKERLYEKKQK